MSLDSIGVENMTFRGYESPLSYFRAMHSKQDLTRSEFAEMDPYAYKMLLFHGQIDLAIPDRDNRGGRRDKILSAREEYEEAFYQFKGDDSKAADYLNRNPKLIRWNWRQCGLIPPQRRGRPNAGIESINEILSLYDSNSPNASLASRNSGYSASFILRVWRKNGLQTRTRVPNWKAKYPRIKNRF